MAMPTDLALLRLLQLVSPGLPIGMYSYSQGLESAIEAQWIRDGAEACEWISGLLENCQARIEVPLAARMYDAWAQDDSDRVDYWSRYLLANRETMELRDEDCQTGQALARLLAELQLVQAEPWIRQPGTTLSAMYTLAAVRWCIPKREALMGLLWSWLENQVLCAVKLVPLGQVAGQRLLQTLGERIPACLDQGMALDDAEIGGSVFGLALASSRHEMQYSRLFRS